MKSLIKLSLLGVLSVSNSTKTQEVAVDNQTYVPITVTLVGIQSQTTFIVRSSCIYKQLVGSNNRLIRIDIQPRYASTMSLDVSQDNAKSYYYACRTDWCCCGLIPFGIDVEEKTKFKRM